MMRHFTYEIDERNLRVKLKDLEVPLKDGAWESLEEFSERQHKSKTESGFSGIKISLNRNVVVLGVFATVIISFSLLLFNFISIKNPKAKKENAQNSEERKMAEQVPVLKKEPVNVQPASKPQELKDTVTVKDNAAVVVLASAVTAPVQTAIKSEEPKTGLLVTETKAGELKPQAIQKKPGSSLASELRPAIITEDTEPDVKPD